MTQSFLRLPAFRAFLVSQAAARLAGSALWVLLGFHIYELTRDPLMIAALGLALALPAVTLVLYGGHVADLHSRKRVALGGRLLWVFGSALLTLGAATGTTHMPEVIVFCAFVLGCAGAFTNPAMAGLEAEVVPVDGAVRAVSVLGASQQAAGLAGPLLGGLLFEFVGPAFTYAVAAGLLGLAAIVLWRGVPARPAPERKVQEPALVRIVEGIRIVWQDEILIGSMALDLFAVFFGGAVALLPIFATEILHVGPAGFGLLRAAQSLGALAAMLVAVRHPPRRRAGWALFAAIAGFGVAIIVFALSRSFVLSFLALLVAGMCDGVSMVVRQSIMRLLVPGPMRGRISAVRSVFINASNELGDVESGVLASVLGPVATVWLGGLITLGVVGVTARWAPALLRLDLGALERRNAVS
jgi:MFS family permease